MTAFIPMARLTGRCFGRKRSTGLGSTRGLARAPLENVLGSKKNARTCARHVSEFGADLNCLLAPHVTLGPHVASLGMRFYTGTMFPSEFRNQIFIAEHGSWNRSAKIGYRITLVSRDEQGRIRYSVFAEGWLQGQKAWGRPADVLVMPDGALLVSDDSAGAIYRISYRKP